VKGCGRLHTSRFYKEQWHPDERIYWRLVREYEAHTVYLGLAAVEATKAANYVCMLVRRHLDPTFRLKQGMLTTDPDYSEDSGAASVRRPEYTREQLKSGKRLIDPRVLRKRAEDVAKEEYPDKLMG
jgi:hypothetical protein